MVAYRSRGCFIDSKGQIKRLYHCHPRTHPRQRQGPPYHQEGTSRVSRSDILPRGRSGVLHQQPGASAVISPGQFVSVSGGGGGGVVGGGGEAAEGGALVGGVGGGGHVDHHRAPETRKRAKESG